MASGEESVFERPVIVVDNGSGVFKMGHSKHYNPAAVFPTMVGYPRHTKVMSHVRDEVYVGDAAQAKRGMLTLKYPVENGIVTNWDMMELIWEHALKNELRMDYEQMAVLLSEPPLNPKANRERMAQIWFETFHVPAFYVAIESVLCLYAAGRTTGITLDLGDTVSHAVPVYEGYALPHAIQRINLGGRQLTGYMTKLVGERGYSLKTTAEREIANHLKEKLGYTAENFEQEMEKAQMTSDLDRKYELPDGQVIEIASERFRVSEPLFQPSFLGMEAPGIHEMLAISIKKSDVDIRPDLYSNIILTGGSSLFQGLPERLQSELEEIAPKGVSVKVIAPPERRWSTWIGGTVLANLNTFPSLAITAEEYFEHGVAIVHRKCF